MSKKKNLFALSVVTIKGSVPGIAVPHDIVRIGFKKGPGAISKYHHGLSIRIPIPKTEEECQAWGDFAEYHWKKANPNMRAHGRGSVADFRNFMNGERYGTGNHECFGDGVWIRGIQGIPNQVLWRMRCEAMGE